MLMVVAVGIHPHGGQTHPRRCRDGHRKRAGSDAVSAVVGGPWARHFSGPIGHHRWRKRLASGGAAGLWIFDAGIGVPVTQTEKCGEAFTKRRTGTWRSRLQRAYERPTYAEARAALHRIQRD
jgi:hypothetical protein